MQAQVKHDDTTRSILINVSGVPDIDVTQNYDKNPRVFRPDLVKLTLTNGALGGITVSGYRVLKSGGTSDIIRASASMSSTIDHLTELPAWLQLLIQEAPAGVTSWNQPEPVAL